MTGKVAVLFLTHRWNAAVWARFVRLQKEIGARADTFVLAHASAAFRSEVARFPPSGLLLFEPRALAEKLGYPLFEEGKLVPGSTHYPLLAFARRRPEYGRFLLLEMDVEFTGHWGRLLDALLAGDADFASLHFRERTGDDHFYFWPFVEPAEADREWASDPRHLWRSFNPIYFASRRALELVDAAHRAEWRCHYEILFATVLRHNGCRIVDLTELGDFCDGEQLGPIEGWPVDRLSTVRWRPPISQGELLRRSTGNTLFHPVKHPWFYDGARVRGAKRMRKGAD